MTKLKFLVVDSKSTQVFDEAAWSDQLNMLLNQADNASYNTRLQKYRRVLKRCRICFSVLGICICIFLLVLSLFALIIRPVQDVVNVVVIDTEKPARFTTTDKFLSVTLDSVVIAEGFDGFNMTDPILSKLLSALSPGYLRIGGTSADRLYFVPEKMPKFKIYSGLIENILKVCEDEPDKSCAPMGHPNFTMSGEEWLELNTFAAKNGFTVLFDINVLTRFDNGTWDTSNVESLIRFSKHHNLNVMWELGNEPNAFRHVFSYDVSPNELGNNFITLRKILDKHNYTNALLVGPDTTRPLSNHKESEVYLKQFLETASSVIDAVTWHQYYFGAKQANASDFVNPEIFDIFLLQILEAHKIVNSVEAKPMWLGETSSAYGGGVPYMSNRYIATFIWLDKLGLAAANGISTVMRQSFFKGDYALVGSDYRPFPDWWISILYKTLVGPEVVPCYTLSTKDVRLYCHCTSKNAMYGKEPHVTVFGINVSDKPAKIRIQIPTNGKIGYPKNIFSYILTTDFSIFSKNICLNEKVLLLGQDGNLPPFKPKIFLGEPYVILPPFSSAFLVFSAPVEYCTN